MTPEQEAGKRAEAASVGMTFEDYMRYGYQTPVAPMTDGNGNVMAGTGSAGTPSNLTTAASNQAANNVFTNVKPPTGPVVPVSQSIGQTLDANGNWVTTTSVNSPNNPLGQVQQGQGSAGGDVSTLPPQFQQLYDQLDQYLKRLQQNGQVLNPNVQLDPSKVAEFLNQAHSEIDPYYQGQLKLAKDAISSSLGYGVNQEQQYETQAERNYGDSLRTLGEQSADQGFAQSGIRMRKEGDLAYNTNTAIQQNRDQLSYNAGNAARTFAQSYGTSSLPSMSIGSAPTAVAGQAGFNRSAGSLPLYQLSPDVYDGLVGSQQYQQRADVANRASQLEGAYNTTQGINQARQLIL